MSSVSVNCTWLSHVEHVESVWISVLLHLFVCRAVTLESRLDVVCIPPSNRLLKQSLCRHVWYARGGAHPKQSKHFLPPAVRTSTCTSLLRIGLNFLCGPCSPPWVSRNDRRRSANENRKSNEDARAVLSGGSSMSYNPQSFGT